MMNLYANGVRVLRPKEVTQLIGAIPKEDNKIKYEVLLYTGARYKEMRYLYENPQLFNGVSIDMPNTKALVKKRTKRRNIRLNPKGQRSINQFLYRCKSGLPNPKNWYDDLKRWCKKAGIDDDGIGIKTARKSWESWLITKYPNKSIYVFLSQGHSQITALGHYLNLGFTDEDINQMDTYVSGWI